MSVTAKIILNTPSDGVFRSGQPVSGVIRYNVSKPTKYKYVMLTLKGKGKCEWTTGYGRGKEYHCSSEKVYSQHIMLWNKAQNDTVTLHGQYEYPFTFVLSDDIPGTYQDDICSIIYCLYLEYKKCSFFGSKQEFHQQIPVYSYVSPTEPAVYEKQKKLFSLLGKGERVVSLKVSIENPCTVPGEPVRLNYVVNNCTDVDVVSVRTDLECYTKYHDVFDNDKVRSDHIARREAAGVPKLEARHFSCSMPTRQDFFSIQHSNILHRQYVLTTTVRLPSPHTDLKVEFPIVIGYQKPAVTNAQS